MATDQSRQVVICRTCVAECYEYKSLHREGIILGEVTTLAKLLTYTTNLEFGEKENGVLPNSICTKCIQDLAKSYIFKKKVLESNNALRSQLLDCCEEDNQNLALENDEKQLQECDDVCDDAYKEKENYKSCEKTETDLQELAEAAQMKRELESQMYEETTEEDYADQLTNDDEEGQQIHDEEETATIHPMDDDEDMEYIVQEVAETTEIYHTTEIDEEHSAHHHHEGGHDIDVEEEEDQTVVNEACEEDDEEEVEFEIHVNDVEEDYHEIITDEPVLLVPQDNIKQSFDEKTNSESDHSPAVSLKGKRNRNKSANKRPNPDFQCKVCGKQLSNSSSFKYHMQLHSDETPYKCEICGECFKTRNAFEGHLSTHDPNNPNTCELCGKSYRQPSSLRLHLLSHTGVKPFTCNICGKSLTQKSGYKKHMLTHTGEKPYTCDICGKSFRISSNMLVHRRSHLGEKPFVCKCEKSFGTAEQLKRHMMVHSEETPFHCNFCDKQFKRQSTLRTHIQSHVSQVTVIDMKNKEL